MVTLPFNLGGIIRDSIDAYRKQNNIPEPDEVKALSVYRRRDTFLEEEFELVRDITIDKESIEYIDLFPNITSLTINGIAELDGSQFKHIIDKYPNLENLIIKGQDQLQFLDVSKMKNLKHLELVSNKTLHRIVGLDEVDSLEQLTFYDNSSYLKEEELCEIVSKLSQSGTHCNLDVLCMPTMNKIGISNPENFKWCESVGLGIHGDELKYETQELEQAVKKAQEIVSQYIKPTDTTIQKYAILYQWMCENVRYDHEALDNDHVHTEQGKNVGQFGGINGTVNSLVYGSCVCEGYSKSMQMLLKLCGIPSFDVSCIAEDPKNIKPSFNIDGKKKMHEGDHSILKVNIDGKCYYSDVTWDANIFQNNKQRQYFLLSKQDILTDHKLVGEDRVIESFKSISDQDFQELMKFAQERIKSVNKELEEKVEMEKTPQERLADINKQLEQLRQQYGVIAKQIEAVMRQNSIAPIDNYQQQLTNLLQQRDAITTQISPLIESQRVYSANLEREKEEKHQATLFQIEQITGKRITDISGYAVDPNKHNGVPYAELKDTSQLRNEQFEASSKIDELWMNGETDLKTRQEMKLALINEYNKMVAKAPKPSTSTTTPATDDYEQTQQQFPTSNSSQQTQQHHRVEKHDSIDDEYRKKYNYSSMSDSEKIAFDKRLEEQKRKEQPQAMEKTDREKLEEQRRDLRRQQFAERVRAMGIDTQNLTFEEIMRQQEIIERMNIEKVNQQMEEVEDHGMHM